MLKVWELEISEAGTGAKLSTRDQIYVMLRRLTKKAHTHIHYSLKIKGTSQITSYIEILNNFNRMLFFFFFFT